MPFFIDINMNKGQYVIKENEPAERVYIIKDGEFQVTKSLVKKHVEDEKEVHDIYDDPHRFHKLSNQFLTKNNAKQSDKFFI